MKTLHKGYIKYSIDVDGDILLLYECTLCDKSFLKFTKLKRHYALIHPHDDLPNRRPLIHHGIKIDKAINKLFDNRQDFIDKLDSDNDYDDENELVPITRELVQDLRFRGLGYQANLLVKAFRDNCALNNKVYKEYLKKEDNKRKNIINAKRRLEVRKDGKCTVMTSRFNFCGKPVVKGKIYCDKHLAARLAYKKKKLETDKIRTKTNLGFRAMFGDFLRYQ